MRAAVFEKPGLENLKVTADAEEPKLTDHDVLIKVKTAGVNPIDQSVVLGSYPASPMPHIPGAEIAGTVDRVGNHVQGLNKGDRVIVYNGLFDGTCDMCLNGSENTCRNGGLIPVTANGGFAEYVAVPQQNVFKLPDDISWDAAASLPVTGLTPFHALMEASLKIDEYLVVFGPSGNTGMIATQVGKKMGAKVIAVSKEESPKEFGANYVISDYGKVPEHVREITHGKMADVVLNSIGAKAWDSSFASVGMNGRLVTSGGLTGPEVNLNIRSLYLKQIKLIGSTGGTRAELRELIDSSAKDLKVKVWKRFGLEDVKEALEALSAKDREGRILLDVSRQ
jgi:NADPH:quinone reductase-like Zn-dependent oxidoreductase